MNRIMIIEDDQSCIEYLESIIESQESHIVSITKNSLESIKMYHLYEPNIVLIDITLKGRESGFDIANRLREINSNLKIIFLTDYSDNELIELAVELKAYGYIIKPVKKDEILATIKLTAIHNDIKKVKIIRDKIELQDGFSFDIQHLTLTHNNEIIPLTLKEGKLLLLLAKHLNQWMSTEQIMYHIWNELKPISTLRSLVHRLRKKLKRNILLNSNSQGYMLFS